MKKVYEAPEVEIELYELDRSIASNCHIVVTNGPAAPGHDKCYDYPDDIFDDDVMASNYGARPHNVSFYDESTCDCYYTADGHGYWQS